MKNAKELLKKYRAGNCSPEEKDLVESWYYSWNSSKEGLPEPELVAVEEEMWQVLRPKRQGPRIHTWVLIASAAVILFVLSFGFYFLSTITNTNSAPVEFTTDIAPGGNKALLRLADGKTIVLDSAGTGLVANQGNVRIRKTADGQLIYEMSADTSTLKEARGKYNTIETPQGGQYQVILPDQSKVWLNAASSIKFPAAFPGDERRVEITGEAYFEVTKDKAKPFRVVSDKQVVEVLGTHFNINAYTDEPDLKTTLQEGKIQVKTASGITPMFPGQQLQLRRSNSAVLKEVDAEEAIAWKNGLFSFNGADLKTVMRQLARWYDVTVEYQGEIPPVIFSGKIHRNVNISQALQIISYLDVEFIIKDRKIFVKE